MAANKVTYSSASILQARATMGRSPVLWGSGGGSFNPEMVREDNNLGDALYTNFLNFTSPVATTANQNVYVADGGVSFRSWEGTSAGGNGIGGISDIPVGVTGSLIPPAVGLAFGAIELNTGTTINETYAIESGNIGIPAGPTGTMTGTFALPSSAATTAPVAGQLPKLFFETRVRFKQILNASIFIGLAKPNDTSTGILYFTAGNVWVPQTAIGFIVNSTAGAGGLNVSGQQIQPFYGVTTMQVANGSQTLGTANTFQGTVGGIPSSTDYPGNPASTAYTGTTTADLLTNWTKLGFVVDATGPDGVLLEFYQDNVLLADLTLSQIVGAQWPSNVALTPAFAIQNKTAVVRQLDIDWLACGQHLSVE
jgi:hypothetical protein